MFNYDAWLQSDYDFDEFHGLLKEPYEVDEDFEYDSFIDKQEMNR